MAAQVPLYRVHLARVLCAKFRFEFAFRARLYFGFLLFGLGCPVVIFDFTFLPVVTYTKCAWHHTNMLDAQHQLLRFSKKDARNKPNDNISWSKNWPPLPPPAKKCYLVTFLCRKTLPTSVLRDDISLSRKCATDNGKKALHIQHHLLGYDTQMTPRMGGPFLRYGGWLIAQGQPHKTDWVTQLSGRWRMDAIAPDRNPQQASSVLRASCRCGGSMINTCAPVRTTCVLVARP